ncbi:class II aldolase and adducin N-terminal domain protein [Treponema primitia ZAS-2]|uniref:Class II aldolase and adducin N-terminal domain protein n=1 Tax=Treponema primitia (strain ATCC BAA-887 / DSM 12427 / ZAS-2) TaxID=545694 RepID=F5YNX5_TREPZ|nr:class II aldolase/adducin family protein [Treponema primitia]AEF84466.1 class II aldolase and adducin N-terminal domain protein [Treponema primitia ZAS-2]
MVKDGYVKYRAIHTPAGATESPLWAQLNEARTRLHDLGLVGEYPGGPGYGNVSVRLGENDFLISGTATGEKRVLTINEYSWVSSFDIEKNTVTTKGPVQASSESMTHGAVYRAFPGAVSVLHIHSRKIFDGMLRDGYPSTPAGAAYGTPEIALAISDCVARLGKPSGVIVMAGHDEGVIAWGPGIDKALDLVLELCTKYKLDAKN